LDIDLPGGTGYVGETLPRMSGIAPTVGNGNNLSTRVVGLGAREPRGICGSAFTLLPRHKKGKEENQHGN